MTSTRTARSPARLLRTACVALLLAGLAAGSASGCKPEEPNKLLPGAFPAAPADSAREGELGAGTENAFGFVLPRGMRVTARMDDTVYAKGRVGFEAAKRYLREQLVDTTAQETPTRMLLEDAHLVHRPKDKFRFVLTQTGNGVELVVRVTKYKEAEAGLSEAERWKRAGLTPDGRVIENQAQ